jgi:hypothetical protein
MVAPTSADDALQGGTRAMVKGIRLWVALLVAVVIFPVAVVTGEEKAKTFHPISYSGNMLVDKTIEIGIDHRGVKLEAITFSGNEALLVTWNRTPNRVKAGAGVALFDDKNRLVAAESDSRPGGISSGKQGNFKIDFKKFLADFSSVARFQVVFVIEE